MSKTIIPVTLYETLLPSISTECEYIKSSVERGDSLIPKSEGIITASITWTTPLSAWISAILIFAPSRNTSSSVIETNKSVPASVGTIIPSESSLFNKLPTWIWFERTYDKDPIGSESNELNRLGEISENAESVGANNVNGP